MLEILRLTKGTIQIQYPSDVEAKALADQVYAILIEAGWTASRSAP